MRYSPLMTKACIDNGILKVLKIELGGLREQLFFFFFRKVGVGRCVFFISGLGLIRDGVRVLAMSNLLSVIRFRLLISA